jgi:hypothetical protein
MSTGSYKRRRVYLKVSGLAACSENCKRYSSLHTRCSCIAILWVSLVSCAAISLCVASQRVIPKVSVYFVIDWVRKLLDTPSYTFRSVTWYLRNIELLLPVLKGEHSIHTFYLFLNILRAPYQLQNLWSHGRMWTWSWIWNETAMAYFKVLFHIYFEEL